MMMKNQEFLDESRALAGWLIENLGTRGEKITFAESCTAGLLSGTFCAVSGASAVYDGGIVSYANEIKHRLLGVSKELLHTRGAVSRECAADMAIGAARLFSADLALAVTGIAGPGGGTAEKPVGTVYISAAYKGRILVEHCFFEGDRDAVRAHSVHKALEMGKKILNNGF